MVKSNIRYPVSFDAAFKISRDPKTRRAVTENCPVRDQHIGHRGNEQSETGLHVGMSNWVVLYRCQQCSCFYEAQKSPERLERDRALCIF